MEEQLDPITSHLINCWLISQMDAVTSLYGTIECICNIHWIPIAQQGHLIGSIGSTFNCLLDLMSMDLMFNKKSEDIRRQLVARNTGFDAFCWFGILGCLWPKNWPCHHVRSLSQWAWVVKFMLKIGPLGGTFNPTFFMRSFFWKFLGVLCQFNLRDI